MRIGFVGLGKLGLPVALAIASRGHEVLAFDTSPAAIANVGQRRGAIPEQGLEELFETASLKLSSIDELVAAAEIVFVAVQTPHAPRFDGASRLPEERRDFDYSHLRDAVSAITDAAVAAGPRPAPLTLAIISTVLPGTIEREIEPLLPPDISVAYNPSFTAMGTTVRDFLNPEFVLVGVDGGEDAAAAGQLRSLYATIHARPVFTTDVRTAELIKVAYNTFIGQKIVFANTMMELAHKLGADVDDLSRALAHGTDRIISPRYLQGGMGDGGPCHPRDNVALSWLSRELDLAHDVFGDIMAAREHQTEWFAELIVEHAGELPIVLLGKAFKAGSPLVDGSPALLLAEILDERGLEFTHLDDHVDGGEGLTDPVPSLFFTATSHPEYAELVFPDGSIVLDPWGYIPDRDGIDVVRIGRR
jgi:UDPglucose 6-dehydrogenase